MSDTTPRTARAVSEYRTVNSFSVLAGPVRGELLLVCNICLRRTALDELSDKVRLESEHSCRPHDSDRSWSRQELAGRAASTLPEGAA
jgi:hypothetical protein